MHRITFFENFPCNYHGDALLFIGETDNRHFSHSIFGGHPHGTTCSVVGFQRIFHFTHVAQNPMWLGVLSITPLPAVSTFWRWLKHCGIEQADSMVKLMAVIRERVWWQVGYAFQTIHVDIDTTVATVYVDLEGARKENYRFIIAVKVTVPPFVSERWCSVRGRPGIEFNSCVFKPSTWEKACRFVAMRQVKTERQDADGKQADLFDEADYDYRIFVTEITAPAHRVIDEYDGRAGAEPLNGAAQREGLCAIPSKAFAPNMVFFPMVMLVYNLWRYLQAFAEVHKKYFELKITIF
ncbi:MAG: hypothetical protein ONB46_17345 [candidate division KSB1 bacterium]|nr:hypothetical protein [candidate division KSB1 bacterium]